MERLYAVGRHAEVERLHALGRCSAPGWNGRSGVAPDVEVAVALAVVLVMAREATKISSA